MSRIKSKKYSGVYYNILANGDISYYITFKDEYDKKIWRKVGKKSEGINESFCYQMRNSFINKIKFGEEIPVKYKKKKKYTLDDAFEFYIEYAKKNKKTWLHNDYQPYHKHIKPLFGSKELTSITIKDIEKLISLKLDENYKPKTIHHIVGMLRHLINYNIKHNKVTNYENPISQGKVKLPQIDNERVGFFSKEEIKELLEILKQEKNKTAYYLTVLLVYTGARFIEVTSLTWFDINFRNRLIYFKSTKGGNPRHIVMTNLVYEVLKELKNQKNSELVITNTKGTKIDKMPDIWQKRVDELLENNKNCDSKHRLIPHSLRHTHASWLAMGGMDILQIKEQLGHKKLDMTLRYAHLIPNTRHEKVLQIIDE